MFSIQQKRHIANEVQRILRETKHPELPNGEISFTLHVDGAEGWSWADIVNNGACPNATCLAALTRLRHDLKPKMFGGNKKGGGRREAYVFQLFARS